MARSLGVRCPQHPSSHPVLPPPESQGPLGGVVRIELQVLDMLAFYLLLLLPTLSAVLDLVEETHTQSSE